MWKFVYPFLLKWCQWYIYVRIDGKIPILRDISGNMYANEQGGILQLVVQNT